MKRHVLVSLAFLVLAGCAATLEATAAAATPKAPRTTLTVAQSDYGRIVFDAGGRALYAFTRDPRARSVCYGACAAAWPPSIVRGTLRAPAGVGRSLLGTTRRRDGRLQLTFAGRPLYRYVGDRSPGVVLCQNVAEFGGLWLVVRPGGTLVR